MKRSTIATLATVAGVALVGGGAYAVTQIPGETPQAGATTEPGVINTPTPEPTSSSSAPTPQVTAGAPATPSPEDADAAFLEYVRSELPPTTTIGDASDVDLIAAGHQACEIVESGTAWEDIRLVEGEQPTEGGYYLDTSAILNGALYNYCPELIPDVSS